MRKNTLLGIAVAALGVGAAVLALPGANAQGRDHFRFEPGRFDNAVVGAGEHRAPHLYLPYTVTNAAGDAREPTLRLEVRTDTGKTFHDTYDARVFSAVRERLRESAARSSTSELRRNELAAGKSANGLANFGRVDPHADVLEVRVHGLWDPVVRDRKGVVWKEDRVLVLTYGRPGDEYDRQRDSLVLKSRKEVVEGEPVQLHTSATE